MLSLITKGAANRKELNKIMAGRSGGRKIHRDAKTGRLVTKGEARQNPRTTLSENSTGGSTGRSRDTVTDRFVTERYARRNPDTTVTES